MSKRISGTKEWSVQSVNIVLGCSHKCRYCYARADAARRKQIPDGEVWGETYFRLREKEVSKDRKLVNGTVMFPSTHDILPAYLGPALNVIGKILRAGNHLLIVSKPHLECVQAVCRQFKEYRESILFRFTIGAMDSAILQYWEPGALAFDERLSCLQHAYAHGFQTSVSCEPLLDSIHARALFDAVAPYVTDTIWIGKMNGIDNRVEPDVDPLAIQRIREGQTDSRVREVYSALRDEPKVRWKESYKNTLGLNLATEAGLDL